MHRFDRAQTRMFFVLVAQSSATPLFNSCINKAHGCNWFESCVASDTGNAPNSPHRNHRLVVREDWLVIVGSLLVVRRPRVAARVQEDQLVSPVQPSVGRRRVANRRRMRHARVRLHGRGQHGADGVFNLSHVLDLRHSHAAHLV